MPRKDGATTRRERMEHIARAVMKALAERGQLPLQITVAELSYETGLSEAKVTDYLETLAKIRPFYLDHRYDKIALEPDVETDEEAVE